MFFNSVRVPNSLAPLRITETLASQRKLPSSRLPSFTPRYTSTSRSAFRYSPASSELRRSGSLTISISGTPARLRSTKLSPPPASWMFLPASSSRWMRRMPMRFSIPSTSMTRLPYSHSGWSYWLIW